MALSWCLNEVLVARHVSLQVGPLQILLMVRSLIHMFKVNLISSRYSVTLCCVVINQPSFIF
jgi:hypothetical protein